MADLPDALRAELAKLDMEQILALLCELFNPTMDGPFSNVTERFSEELAVVDVAFEKAYRRLDAAARREPEYDA